MDETIFQPTNVAPVSSLGASYNPFAPPHRDDPYLFYAQARCDEPVCYIPHLNLWLVTRHEDALTVLRDPVRFSSADFLKPMIPWPPEIAAVLDSGYPEVAGLVNNDPPSHDRIRGLFSAGFSPRRIAEMEPQIRALAHELVDQFAAQGQVDLVHDFADPLPMIVIGDLLGIPRSDIRMLKRYCDDRMLLYAPEIPVEQKLVYVENYMAFQRYCEAMIAERRTHPRDDLTTALVEARIDGMTPLTNAEIIVNMLILFFAGHETTSSVIAQMVYLLQRNPEQWQALQADRSLIPAAIEEVVRIGSPVQGEPRTTTEPVELGGTQLPAGARVHVMYASANHDDAVFPNPERFDPRRDNLKRHLGFGWGIHFCLGAALARLEARIALETLLDRLPNLQLAPDHTPEFVPSFFLRNPTRLPLSWDAA
ncbi:MAG: cytochrome P450 [Chloroflexi bacterium]|nr:cytochrome P450 [Chloroflexota bacterium]